jgi:hypothetical protein
MFVVALAISLPTSAEQAEKKLSEKMSNNIIVSASVKGCDDDVNRYCEPLKANSNKVFMCLAAYEELLSNQCKQGILEASMAMKLGAAALDYSIRACEADADKYCLDVEPGEGRLVNCIKQNESKVSKECITALKETGFWDIGN